MSIDEIVAAINRLEADSITIATALQKHTENLPVSSQEYANLHKLHRAIADFYIALTLWCKDQRRKDNYVFFKNSTTREQPRTGAQRLYRGCRSCY
jgi:hypothetical protein